MLFSPDWSEVDEFCEPLLTNPATGQAWTAAEVNALQAGIMLDSTTWIVRVTQAYVSVDAGESVVNLATYAYADGPTGINELTSITGVEPATFTYTTNGDVWTKIQAGVTWTYAYNEAGLLASVKQGATTVAQYFYDGLGRRVKSTEPSGSKTLTTYFVFSGDEVLFTKRVVGTTVTKTSYVYAAGLLVASVTGTTKAYFHQDHLGNTRLVTRGSTTDFKTNYKPFGPRYAPTGTDPKLTYTGEWTEPLGLVYLRARYYDPDLGRFVSKDPVLGSLGIPQTLNRYAYVVNNPLKYTDPTGEFWFKNPIGDWWDSLDSNWKTAIVFTVLTIAVIASAGVLAPAILGTVIAGAAISGAISGGIYVASAAISEESLSLGGFAASIAQGAFLGAAGAAVGSVAAGLASKINPLNPWGASRIITGFLGFGVGAGTELGGELVRGEAFDPFRIMLGGGLSVLSGRLAERLYPSFGMNPSSFGFSPWVFPSLRSVGRAVLNPSLAGPNARAVLYGGIVGPLVESSAAIIESIGGRSVPWYHG